MKHLTLVVALLVATSAFAAQGDPDPRWAPFVGCWDAAHTGGGAHVCVTRSGDNAASLATTVEGQPAVEQTLVADGSAHAVADGDCRGTQRAEWSRDGQRLYTHAELTCQDGKPRTVSGLAMIAPDGTWLDVQAVTINGGETTRARRFRRSLGATGSSATYRGMPLTLDAVKDAIAKVSAPVVEAALAETRASFDLSSHSLIDLADAGVPPRLIDVLIALSYPKHFVVERTASLPGGPMLPLSIDEDPFLLGWAFGAPGFAYPFGLYPTPFYSPFGYAYSGFYTPFEFTDVPLSGGGGGGGGAGGIRPSGAGRAIDGLGYTRMRPREEGPAQPVGPNRPLASANNGSANPGSSTPSASTVSSQGYTSGGSSSSGSSSGGSSSGSDSGGRTAVPR